MRYTMTAGARQPAYARCGCNLHRELYLRPLRRLARAPQERIMRPGPPMRRFRLTRLSTHLPLSARVRPAPRVVVSRVVPSNFADYVYRLRRARSHGIDRRPRAPRLTWWSDDDDE